ncbi:MAG: 3-deoxy-D-manno-octulosonic acid transferase [Phycisphaerales bacterium]|nr:3-deoxy-D-manno-octulosonic acid transferase [Phycisphaerales bacterium]
MRFLVDLFYLLAVILVTPVLLYRMLVSGKYRSGWLERLGYLPDLPESSSIWPRVWIHAVSVGELNAVRGLIAAWRKESPESSFLVSTTTDTGYARARELFPDLIVVRYPLDMSRFVRRALNRVGPRLIVLVELEVWYQFVTQAARQNIPVAVINGRLSAKSIKWFNRIGPLSRRMFGALRWVGAQDEEYAERFRQAGVPAGQVEVMGSLKWDTAEIADELAGTDELARAMGIGRRRPVWVCGSTGPGEEKVILQAYQTLHRRHPTLQLVIVPRKPERFDEVANLIRQTGYQVIRRSESPDGTTRPPAVKSVMLGDTMGELRKFYFLASVVFVGRSLAAMGGSDMMEVAALAKPIVVGPHNENFADIVAKFQKHQAIRVLSKDLESPDVLASLTRVVAQLVDNPTPARQLADNARAVVQANRGATKRTLKYLMEMV